MSGTDAMTQKQTAIVRGECTLKNGRKVRYLRRKGTKGSLMFLHGFSGDAEGCRELMSRMPDGYDVVVPDLPGFGFSDDPVFDDKGFKRLIEPLAELADHCYGNRRFHMVGHSYGGMCAFYFAAAYPGRLRSLTILAPIIRYRFLTHAVSRFGMKLNELLGPRYSRKIYAAHVFVDMQTMYLARGVSLRRYQSLRMARRREANAVRPSFPRMIELFDRFQTAAADMRQEVPTLIVIGKHDTIADRESGDWFAKRSSDASITTLKSTHLFPVLIIDETVDLIGRFIDGK